jgi:cyclohexadieny/prephenate dehydrogenase
MSASFKVDTVAILGLGLIGGSLAKALKKSGFARRLIAYGHREPSLKRGVELSVIDSYTLDLDEAINSADIIVIATPTLIASDMLRAILPKLEGRSDGPVITDVASVKGNLQAAAIAAVGSMPAKLILAHPIAGSERSGVEAADENLFVNHRVILTPVEGNDNDAIALVRDMWLSTKAEVVSMAVPEHDAVLAATSHLPHMLAYALVDALAQSNASEDIFRFAAGGFRDFTRIASSDPVMWRDIALANRSALLEAVDLFSDHLAVMRVAIDSGDSERLHEIFTRAKGARDEFSRILAARNK